jgi:hypothetical protein
MLLTTDDARIRPIEGNCAWKCASAQGAEAVSDRAAVLRVDSFATLQVATLLRSMRTGPIGSGESRSGMCAWREGVADSTDGPEAGNELES